MNITRSTCLGLVLSVLLPFARVQAQHQIGFIEKFALAADRDAVLKELIPGTDDYYFYHALHFQTTGRQKELDEILAQWSKRDPNSAKLRSIRHRQALANYEKNPQATLQYLRQVLGVSFNHQQETLNPKPGLPTKLDPALIALQVYQQRALGYHDNLDPSHVTDLGLEHLLSTNAPLTVQQRRALLSRIKRPDVPNLLEAVLADLGTQESRGFGEFPIHRQLLLEQLQQLARQRSTLLQSPAFVEAWLVRLRPGADIDLERNVAARQAWLEDSWSFVKDLTPAFNSLKAHILYQRLLLDQKLGKPDAARLVEYLKLPRQVGYASDRFLQDTQIFRYPVDLNADFVRVTACPPVGNDESLVRALLLEFMKGDGNIKTFAPYIADGYLKRVLAEAKLTTGVGNAEQWFSMMSPSEVQALRERVDIDFAATNPETYGPVDAVNLDVFVKNVPKLVVNVFEINTENYYRAHNAQIGTDLNLDGLIANKQQSAAYAEAPVLRVKRTFKLDELPARRGVWMVDLIGNGKSSRALIRKGQLHFVTRPSSAGTALTVLDEARQPVVKAYALVGAQRYAADEHGEILIPFTNKPGRQAVIIGDGAGFSQLENVELVPEAYSLTAGVHVARESLIAGKKAIVAIRPTLTVNGAPVDLSLVEDVRLTIISHNQDGVASSLVKPGFKFEDGRESTVELTVPERLAGLDFQIEGKVKSLLTGDKVNVASAHSIALNQLDKTERTSDLDLSRVGADFILQELGRTGEPRSEHVLVLRLWRAEFGQEIQTEVKTDASGAVLLGSLEGIRNLSVTSPNGSTRAWTLPVDRADTPVNVHVLASQPVLVPWMETEAKPKAPLVSLLEVRQGNFVRNALTDETLSVKSGYLVVSGLAPGDYSLRYGRDRKEVTIRVTEGTGASGWLIGEARHLQARPSAPLQIALAKSKEAELTFFIGNATKDTRVHLLASRFLPDYDAFQELGNSPDLEPLIGQPGRLRTLYVSGRTLGEEYRYVLERRLAKKYPGSMLPRPGLLLNPWVLRNTETALDEAKPGEVFHRAQDGRSAGMAGAKAKKQMAPGEAAGYADASAVGISSVDFLADAGLTAFNLTPDKDGYVTVKLASLADRQFVRVLALNGASAVVRDLSLADAGTKVRDLAFRHGLDPKSHFTEQNQVTIIEKDAPFTIKDASTAKLEMQNDLGDVFKLFGTLSHFGTLQTGTQLTEFSFILDWPKLDAAKKRELYSKNACHELSFFLQRKDPEFFKTVILPYLANKKDKTFMDRYLLGEELQAYLRPWDYERLNIVERILLAQRHKDEAAATAREIAELNVMLPVDVEKLAFFFDSALLGNEMTGGDIYAAQASITSGADLPQATPMAPAPAMRLAAPAAPADAFAGSGNVSVNSAATLTLGSGVSSSVSFGGVVMNEKDSDEKSKFKEAEGVKALADNSWGMRQESLATDALRRSDLKRQLYRKLDPTQEWAENNYYKLPIEDQLADLVSVNGFWKDYAAWDGKGGFLSTHFAEASRNFTEMMFALSVLDLPFPDQAKEPKTEVKDVSITLTPSDRMILIHREIKPAVIDAEAPKLLASQNFYRHGDRYIEANGEKQDKFVTEEFLTGIVYGCQVVVTNPTSSTQKLDLLVQIPQGAIPVLGSMATKSQALRLESYRTFTMDYYFYFPKAGDFAHHPVHVSKSEKVVAFAEPFSFHVVDELTKLDTGSWDYVSQFGKPADVLAFLDQHNVHQLNLDRMAWRLKDAAFFSKALALLQKRHAYHATTWSYSLMHDAPSATRDYLLHADGFINECGPIKTKLVEIDPVARYSYQHLEYSPLVNARSHRLGAERSILNDRFSAQYEQLLAWFARKAALDSEDRLALSYYLLLQDRIEEALDVFAKVDAKAIAEHLQYDYMKAVCALYQEDTATARQIAQGHAAHAVDRWKDRFQQVLSHIEEMEGKKPVDAQENDREQRQNDLATTEPTLDFSVENKEVKLALHNLKEVTVNYYPMDLEFLFSTAPFVGQDSGRFGLIQPNRTERIVLPADRETHAFALPREYHSSNVLVEITSAGKTVAHAYYANELNVQLSENYGRLQVLHTKDNRPLAKVYVKVFAEINGQPKFYKDGYTDLRGKFDYLSLSTPEIDQATRFSVLVLSEEFGAAVKEAKPPRQ
jgi:hypothetical protein